MDFTIGCVNYFLILHADICIYRTWQNFYDSKSSFFVSLHKKVVWVHFFEAWLLSVFANELLHSKVLLHMPEPTRTTATSVNAPLFVLSNETARAMNQC